MDDVTSNVIDLKARLARLRRQALADDATLAIAELEALRTGLRNLNILVQLHDLKGNPLGQDENIHQLLDEITEELAQCMHLLGMAPK